MSPDGTLAGTALEEWDRKLAEGAHALGKDWHRTSKYKQYLEEAGVCGHRGDEVRVAGGAVGEGSETQNAGVAGAGEFLVSVAGA